MNGVLASGFRPSCGIRKNIVYTTRKRGRNPVKINGATRMRVGLHSDISGVVLAGGKGSRMGFAKSNLVLQGRRIIEITLELLASFFEEILVVTDNKKNFADFKKIRVVEDLVKGCGPLGGIYTGLKKISKDKAFVVACDMPYLQPGLISKLLDEALKDNYSCVVPYSDRGFEPLHTVYARCDLEDLAGCLKRKDLSLRQFLRHCNCKYVKAHKEEAASFTNINTLEDLRAITVKDK